MSQDYKIKAVSKNTKEWESKYGPMITYYIQVEGNGEPVEINKKPDSPAPKEGDEIYGDITETEFGQKFKSASKSFGGGGSGGGYQKSPQQEEAIARAVALKAAVDYNVVIPEKITDVLGNAEIFLTWLRGAGTDAKPATKAPEEPEDKNNEGTDDPFFH